MRLHRLQLCGIGPFAAPTEIDFAQLAENGLFLLEGPTGAGKSTIIDAVSFALYGKVAQASADGERLRSHFAPAGSESWVELTWQTQSGMYRIRRTPKYQRPKRRGDGLRTVNPTATLWRLDDLDNPGTGELLSNRLDEVADEITRAIGLSHAQFVQTVVLPQGEFANFLRAASDEKRALLQKLFGTEMLARVQAELVLGRQRAELERAVAAETLAQVVHSFTGAAAVPDTLAITVQEALAAGDTDTIQRITEQVLTGLAQLLDAASLESGQATRSQVMSEVTLQRAEQLAVLTAKRSTLQTRLAELHRGEPAEQTLREEVMAAERAAPVAAVALACTQAEKRATAAAALADSRRSRLPAPLRAENELSLRAQIDHLNRSRGAVAEHLEHEDELLALRHRVRALARERDDASASARLTKTELVGVANDLSRVSAERERAATTSAGLELLQARDDRCVAVVAAAREAALLEQQIPAAQRRAATAVTAEQDASTHLNELRQRRLDGMAGELGVTLRPGQPCLVCGSCSHPRPARPGQDHVTAAQVSDADNTLAVLTAATISAVQQLNRLTTGASGLRAAADNKSVAEAEQDAQQATHAVELARSAAGQLQILTRRCSELTRHQSELTAQQQLLGTQIEVLTAQLDRSALDTARVERSLDEARAGFATVGERLVDLDGQIEILEDAVEYLTASSSEAAAAVQARSQRDKALAEAGFDEIARFTEAYRTPAQLTVLRGDLAAIRADWAWVHDGLAAPELADPHLDAEPADIEQLSRQLHACREAANEAVAALGAARDRLTQARRHAQQLCAAIEAGRQTLVRTAPAIRLGYLVAGLGDNQLRMDLSTYVLVRRFEQIVAAANEQLIRVSNGRYVLEHSDARHGNARSGLGLRIRDLRTDRDRDPATLSGGETFYVSLSLALGLADVVRAESGGIDLGTLFIDEGFGTLDSDVLDEVIGVLDSLRTGGRSVGIVSHVVELKARIAARIEVRANADGTSRLIVRA